MSKVYRLLILGIGLVLLAKNLIAQNFRPEPTPNDTLKSIRILPDRQVLFRIYAPNAKAVSLMGTDMPQMGPGVPMTKSEDGVWEAFIGPVSPGAYRYLFLVDGVPTVDPRNTSISEANMNVWSMVYIPGEPFMDTRDVPHGTISEVVYFSKSLNRFRRMHVYTPPGYESGKGKYPVFYLLHGAFDCDDAWSTVGRAGFILDNLIVEKKAVPMVVVMPAGHTGPFRFGMVREARMDTFLLDFWNDIKPYIETHYRVYTDRSHRAIAGLSMGGGHTLALAMAHLDAFGYIGVFSSGVFGITGGGGAFGEEGTTWESRHQKVLDDPSLKKGLRLVWFATGKEDFLLETSRATVDVLRRHGFDVVYHETEGGHTWINWRKYLAEFAPLLFK